MLRFYFNIYNDEVTLDEEGIEFPDPEAAMTHAVLEARNLASETVRKGHLNLDHRLEIVDDDEQRVGTVRFGDAVEVLGSMASE